MPPQGLLLIAAYMPEQWPIRVIDENIAPASAEDFAWADVVLVSGMHIQARQIRDIARRAKEAGKITALGGPSVSGAPEMYPEFDYLHIGELGDGTDRLIATFDASCAPPPAQVRFETNERLPLTDFPVPAYHLIPLPRYLMCTLQFSSGCPYLCEFCDIPIFMAGSHGTKRRNRSRPSLMPCARRRDTRRAFISSTTISSVTARRRAKCCRISSNGRSGAAIRCSLRARRRSTSPSSLKF